MRDRGAMHGRNAAALNVLRERAVETAPVVVTHSAPIFVPRPTVVAPVAGIVTEKLVDQGELIAPRMPLVVITDLDRAWADVFVDEPAVPRLRVGQAATLHTDAGGDAIPGTVTFISPKAEFTPRNVQTAEERSRLVYRVKVSVDNAKGVLKTGMPVEAELPLQ